MLTSLKPFLYRHLFALAPQKVRELYFRTKVLVPKGELTQKYSEALEYLLKKGPIGDYLEFGVFRGDSLACMYQVLKRHNVQTTRLFGFDSFEGLPEITDENDRVLPWQKGEFISTLGTTKKNLNKSGIDWKRVFLVKGFFHKTLNRKLIDTYKIKKASLIMVDCDLYSSAKEALDFCIPLIKDHAIIFFDDWITDSQKKDAEAGEKLAFERMLKANPQFTAKEFGTYTHTEQKNSYTAKIFLIARK